MSEGTQKRCCTCGEYKPKEMFDKNKGRKDGLSERCKPCRVEYRAANAQAISEYNKAYKRANAEAVRQYNHDYHAAHAESIHERQRAYKQANAEKMRQSYRAYYAAHVEQYSAHAKAYAAAHPQRGLVNQHRRRARIKGNGGSFTVQQLRELQHAQQGCCAYCERQTKLTIDHIIPIKQGGSNDISNICLACRRCNFSKHAKTPEQWINRWYQKTDD